MFPPTWKRRSIHRLLAPALLTLTLAACATSPAPPAGSQREPQRPLLNSERIEQRFGNFDIEVLESDERVRVSNLFSRHDGRRICRTFAVVSFPPHSDPAVAAEHARVVAGGSIGAVFTRSGWTVDRRVEYVGEIPGPAPADRVARLMALAAPRPLAIEVYSLMVSRGGATIDYAMIAEVHHPEYLDLAALRALPGRGLSDSGLPADRRSPDVAGAIDLALRAMREPLGLATTAVP